MLSSSAGDWRWRLSKLKCLQLSTEFSVSHGCFRAASSCNFCYNALTLWTYVLHSALFSCTCKVLHRGMWHSDLCNWSCFSNFSYFSHFSFWRNSRTMAPPRLWLRAGLRFDKGLSSNFDTSYLNGQGAVVGGTSCVRPQIWLFRSLENSRVKLG